MKRLALAPIQAYQRWISPSRPASLIAWIASGARLGKAVLQHIQVCTGTFERARPDGCMERLCCPRCGGDLDLLQREES